MAFAGFCLASHHSPYRCPVDSLYDSNDDLRESECHLLTGPLLGKPSGAGSRLELGWGIRFSSRLSWRSIPRARIQVVEFCHTVGCPMGQDPRLCLGPGYTALPASVYPPEDQAAGGEGGRAEPLAGSFPFPASRQAVQ